MAPFTTAVRLFAPGPLKQRRQVVVPRLVQSFADEVVDAPFRGQRESIDDAVADARAACGAIDVFMRAFALHEQGGLEIVGRLKTRRGGHAGHHEQERGARPEELAPDHGAARRRRHQRDYQIRGDCGASGQHRRPTEERHRFETTGVHDEQCDHSSVDERGGRVRPPLPVIGPEPFRPARRREEVEQRRHRPQHDAKRREHDQRQRQRLQVQRLEHGVVLEYDERPSRVCECPVADQARDVHASRPAEIVRGEKIVVELLNLRLQRGIVFALLEEALLQAAGAVGMEDDETVVIDDRESHVVRKKRPISRTGTRRRPSRSP